MIKARIKECGNIKFDAREEGTTGIIRCSCITKKPPKGYSETAFSHKIAGWQFSKGGTTRQEALLSLCIKLADELGEEFIIQVKGLIK